MNQFSALVKSLLASTGIYSDVAISRIEEALAANPGMPLIEGILKFGGEKEALFLEKIGGVLGLEYVEIENMRISAAGLIPDIKELTSAFVSEELFG